MADNTIGKILEIPENLLADLDNIDKKIVEISKHSKEMANAFNSAFKGIDTAAIKFISNFSNASKQIENTVNATINASKRVSDFSNGLNSMSTTADGATKRVHEFVSAVNALNNQSVSRKEEVERIAMYSRMFDQIERAEQKSVKDAENAAKQRIRISQQEAAERAKAEKQQTYKQNTSYSGSLSFAETATSINQRTQAIKYLTEARANLSTTDTNYITKLNRLNEEIKRLNSENNKAVAGSKELQRSHSNLINTSQQLARQLALVFSISQIKGYVDEVIRVRGEFELQLVSLGAILQDTQKAASLFSQIKNLAIVSPFSTKELTTYAKSLAAYQVQYEELYDTTKMLADVSAGLGVDMQRMILAFGQVKAANILRGTEVRQFTEAGLNILGELAKYYSELEGTMVSVGEVQERVTKRMVSFGDVEEVFNRVTSAGGIFYNMQEKQAESLAGQMSNLRDRIDLMLDDIGKNNQSSISAVIKGVTTLLDNYELVAGSIKYVVTSLVAYKLASFAAAESTKLLAINFGVLTKDIPKHLSLVQILTLQYKRLTASIAGANNVLKTFGTFSAIGLSITMIVSAISEVVRKSRELKEALNEVSKQAIDNSITINELSRAYEKLAESYKKANDEYSKNELFKEKKQELVKLVNELTDRGYSVPINVEIVTPENIDEEFQKAADKLISANVFSDILNTEFVKETEGFDWFGLSSNIVDATDRVSDAVNVFDIKMAEDVKKMYQGAKSLPIEFSEQVDAIFLETEEMLNKEYLTIEDIRKLYENFIKIQSEVIQKSPSANLSESQKTFITRINIFMSTLRESIGKLNSEKKSYEEQLGSFFDTIISNAGGIESFKKKFAEMPDVIISDILKTFSEGGIVINEEVEKMIKEIAAKRFQINLDLIPNVASNVNFFGDFRDAVSALDTNNLFRSMLQNIKTLEQMEDALQKGYKDLNSEMEVLNRANTERLNLSEQINEQEKIKSKLELNSQEYKNAEATIENLKSQKNLITTQIDDRRKLINSYKDEYELIAKSLNLRLVEEKKSGKDDTLNKFKQRLSFFERINKEYENLLKNYDEEEAKNRVKKSYGLEADALGVGDIFQSADFDDAGTLKSFEKVKSSFKKMTDEMRAEYEKVYGSVFITMEVEMKEQDLDSLQNQFSNLMTNYGFTLELENEGLGREHIKSLFGLDTMDLDQITEELNNKWIELANKYEAEAAKMQGREAQTFKDVVSAVRSFGTQGIEEYNNQMQKLSDTEDKELKERLKKYSKYLKDAVNEMVKIELQAAQELSEIQSLVDVDGKPIGENEKSAMRAGVINKMNEELNRQAWSEFQSSEMYIRMFEDLDSATTKSLNNMKKKLEELKQSMGENLSPEDIKEIVSRIEEIDNITLSRNPFKDLGKNIVEVINNASRMGDIVQRAIDSQSEVDTQQSIVDSYQKVIGLKQKGISMDTEGLNLTEQEKILYGNSVDELMSQLSLHKNILNEKKEQNNEDQEALQNAEKLRQIVGQQITEIAGYGSQIMDIFGTISENFEMSDAAKDTLTSVQEIGGSLMNLGSNVGQLIANPANIGAWIGAIKSLVDVVVNSIRASDRILEREIQNNLEMAERLEEKYDSLKESMETAFSIEEKVKSFDDAMANLDERIRIMNENIAAEQDKKNTDDEKVEEYRQQQEDLIQAQKELQQQFLEEMGGFGSDEAMASAADDFANAWLEAYRETGDGLDALNESWDEYIDNVIKKQLMLRGMEKFLEPIMEDLDKRIEDGTFSSEDYDALQQQIEETMPELNEFWKSLMDMWGGFTPDKEYGMSGLSKGIQSITEETAQALEALFNSMRMFVADSNLQLKNIYNSIAYPAADNPYISELKLQTTELKALNTLMNSLTKVSSGNGKALKVLVV